MTLWTALRRPSPRALLGASAVADFMIRLPEEILAPLLSITGGLVGGPTIGFVTTWLMFGIAFYIFGPLALAHLEQLPTDDKMFVSLFSTFSVIVGILIHRFDSLEYIIGFAVSGSFASGILLLGYLVWRHDWKLDDPSGSAVGLLELFTPKQNASSEIASDFRYQGFLGLFARVTFISSIGMLLGMTVFCAAFAGQILLLAFPLPDFIFFGWAISTRLIPQLPWGPNGKRLNDFKFDIELFLLQKVKLATRSDQGMYTTLFILTGLFGSGGYLFLAVSLFSNIVGLYQTGVRDEMLGMSQSVAVLLWNWTGFFILLLSAGTCAFWVWIREFQRLPYFLDHWEGRLGDLTGPPARMTGFLIVPLTAWCTAVWFIYFGQPIEISWYSLVWPLLIAATVGTIVHTNRRLSQSTKREHIWIASGLWAHGMTIWIGGRMPAIIDAVGTGTPIVSLLPIPLMMLLLIGIIGSIPTVSRYERQHDDIRQYSFVGLLLILGGLSALGSEVVPHKYRVALSGMTVLCLTGGVIIGLVDYYDI